MAKAALWSVTDAEARKLGANRLDTLVVHAVNDELKGPFRDSVPANSPSTPPGEYDQRLKPPKELTGPAIAVEHVATRRTPYQVHSSDRSRDRVFLRDRGDRWRMVVVSSCRGDVGLSPATSATS